MEYFDGEDMVNPPQKCLENWHSALYLRFAIESRF